MLYKITERILETRVIYIDADSEDEAFEKASDIDYEKWLLEDLNSFSTQIEEAYQVIDRATGKVLTDEEIIAEVNRDRSDEWSPYTVEELRTNPDDVLEWIDLKFYEVN